MIVAYNIIKLTVVEYLGFDLGQSIIESVRNEILPENLIQYLPEIIEAKAEMPSLKSEGANHIGGLSNYQRYASHAELNNI